MSRCEVCDDTNATIHCQECRRNTCEECDEILHLVDANKSHHRIPLFPSRGGSAVHSRQGSYAPTRTVSPRGPKRDTFGDAGSSYTPQDVGGYSGGISSGMPSTGLTSGATAGMTTAMSTDHFSGPSVGITSQQNFSDYSHTASSTMRHYTDTFSTDLQKPAEPMKFTPSMPDHPPDEYLGGGQSAMQGRPNQPMPMLQHHSTRPQMMAPPQSITQMGQPQSKPLQPYRSSTSGSVYAQHAQARSGHATPTMQSTPMMQPMPQPMQQPQPRPQVRSGHSTPAPARSGTATPTYGYQHPTGSRSVSASGTATPTYGSMQQRYQAGGGAIPFNQWPSQQQQPQARHQGAPMQSQQNRPPAQMAPSAGGRMDPQQQQAYMQHMQVIQQHRAVEAHQRLMSQRNGPPQPGPPGRPVMMAPGQPQPRYGNYMVSGSMQGSVNSSAAPSARNSPPMQPMRDPMGAAVPGMYLEPPRPQFIAVQGQGQGGGQPWPKNPPRQQAPGMQGQPSIGWGQQPPTQRHPGPPQYSQQMYAPYSLPASASRTPHNEPRSPPPELAYPPARSLPHSMPRTPYNEPRTPYNEPRTPNPEPSGWRPQQYAQPRPTVQAPPPPPAPVQQQAQTYVPQRSYAANSTQQSYTQQTQQSYVQPAHAPSPPAPAPAPAPVPAQSYQSSPTSVYNSGRKVPQKEDLVMTPNGSLARLPASMDKDRYGALNAQVNSSANTSYTAQNASYTTAQNTSYTTQQQQGGARYDPDEAEARVRNLIADTERMLAGLSGFSGPSPTKGNGLSV